MFLEARHDKIYTKQGKYIASVSHTDKHTDLIDCKDWDKINEKIEENKGEGVVISGPYFPMKKM